MAPSVTLLHSKRAPFRLNGQLSRLLTSLRLISHQNPSLEGVNVPSSTTNTHGQLESFPQETDRSLPIDPGAFCERLVDPVIHLQSLLPGSCEWLEQGELEVVGEHPLDAGCVADVRVGKMGDRKFAIKVYRCYSSSNCSSTYAVGSTYLLGAPLTKGLSAETLQ